MTWTGLVLAGTRPGGDPLAGLEGKVHKALLDLAGEPLLARVVAALWSAGAERVVVSCEEGPVAQLARQLGAIVRQPAFGPSGSVDSAFAEFGSPLVVTTADNGLLQASWIEYIVNQTPAGVDVALMLARQQDVEAAMPGTRRTWLRFADGGWSGCNLFYFACDDARRALGAWSAIEADRKRPWRIASRIGLPTLLTYLSGRLTAADAIARLGAKIGVVAVMVPSPDGLAALDVDKASDLADIRRLVDRTGCEPGASTGRS